MYGLSLFGGATLGAIAAFCPTLAFANPIASSPSPLQLSQQNSVSVTVQQGTQIQLNGRIFSAPWQQWQTANGSRIGISDVGLIRTTGLQLLNSNTVTLQPVQWFTPTNQTLSLPTQLTSTLRYLDIADLVRQFGWQLSTRGSVLQLSTPMARVLGLRQGKQPWGDRLVIELDRPTPWQSEQSSQELAVTLDAQIDAAVLQQFKPSPGNYIQSIQAESSANQTRLRLTLSSTVRSRIWSVSAPNRIVIDTRPDSLVEQNILWAPGLRWRQQLLPSGNTKVPVVWLEVNPRQPGLTLQPIVPNPGTMLGTAPLAQTAQQAQVAAAINGGFFNRNRQLPLGAIRLNGRWLSGPILNRGAIAWDAAGNVKFGRLTLRETVTTQTGQRFPLTHLNSGYIQAGIARYTPDWGSTYTSLSDGEIIVFVQNNQIVGQQTVEKAGTAAVQIPLNGYILVLRSIRSAATAFIAGTALQLESLTDPPDFNTYPQIIAAGPLLIQNRQPVLDAKAESFSNAFAIESASRSAIVQQADGSLLLIATHTRLDGTSLTLPEFAQLLQQFGVINALNLDGGSSTTLYLGGQILDRPPRTAARVHSGIGIFLKTNP
ncbi:MAG: phosphodiester glycosidase family protein [Oscillatoriales cyanobacterium C42_A2020_001]|nr:phosphodiester glycosidase family protein [Leptolyngbyaceae cyanobacterium C42_A2020_001]